MFAVFTIRQYPTKGLRALALEYGLRAPREIEQPDITAREKRLTQGEMTDCWRDQGALAAQY